MKGIAASVALGLAAPASAAVTDFVWFRVAPIVMVWAANAAGTTPVVSDFVLLNSGSGTAGNDIIAGNVRPVITGSMTAIPTALPGAGYSNVEFITPVAGGAFTDNAPVGELDATDVLTAITLDANTDIQVATTAQQHSFYVASNAPFDIFADTSAGVTTVGLGAVLADVSWSMAVQVAGTDAGVAYGAAAQDPTAGGGSISAATDLSAFSPAAAAFTGGQRTAASTGTILDHSVRFTVSYGLNYDLSMGTGTLTVPVTYTIYTP